MATLNKAATSVSSYSTHEGGVARKQSTSRELERAVLACLLWENSFYESGEDIATRIGKLVHQADPLEALWIATTARQKMYIRHAPLLIARELARGSKEHKAVVKDTLYNVIQRADELAEFVAIYWKDKKQPLSAQVKKGLAEAFTKFSEYDLAKYNRDNAIKLRDVLFLTHAKPKSEEQAALWKRLIDGTLETPDTWEVAISSAKGKDTAPIWTRLLEERKLGGLALLRNLRNMYQAGVKREVVREAILVNKFNKVLPFRFFAAAKHIPTAYGIHDVLETAMLKAASELPKLKGRTAILVDNSGSMNVPLSAKSDLYRTQAAQALAVLVREVAEDPLIVSFGNHPIVVNNSYRGFALAEKINNAPTGGSTATGKALKSLQHEGVERTIIITDEQSHDTVGAPYGTGYVMNVASYKPTIAYGQWTSLTGFSENLVRYITEVERED